MVYGCMVMVDGFWFMVQPIKGKIADPEKFRAFHLQFVSRRGGFSTCSSCRGGRVSRFSLAVRVEGKKSHLHFVWRRILFFNCKFVSRSGFFIFNLQFVSRGVFSTSSSCNVGPCATPPYRYGGAVAPELCVRLYSVGDLGKNTSWRGPIS